MAFGGTKIEGAAAVKLRLAGASKELGDLRPIHKEAAQVVEKDAKPRARVLSGKMAGSIRSSGTKTKGVARIGFASTPWVPIQYWGHPARNISPNPSIGEAAEAREPEIVEVYDSGLNVMLKQSGLV